MRCASRWAKYFLVLSWLACAGAAFARPAGSPPVPELPPPGSGSYRPITVIGWQEGEAPAAPRGFQVEPFARETHHARWLYVLPNGDVLAAQSRTETLAGFPEDTLDALRQQGVIGESPDSIWLFRQTANGTQRYRFLYGLHQPFGMALLDGYLYVANTDALLRFQYRTGQTRIVTPAESIIELPAGERANPWNNHWTRNVVVAPDGQSLFVSVGAGTDVNAEGVDPPDRAAIWKIDPDGGGKRLFSTGLRNPTGMDFDPFNGDLWTTVNERDGLGEDVPPDYLTRVVDGAFYGWPWVYFGTYPDPAHLHFNPDRVAAAAKRARVPDLALGGHTVPLGLAFYTGEQFPLHYRGGAFIARRGGVGRASFLGFDVVYVPFENGTPVGEPEAFLTGFVADTKKGSVHGRPVGLAFMKDGSMLVADDSAHVIWRVRWIGEAGRD